MYIHLECGFRDVEYDGRLDAERDGLYRWYIPRGIRNN
jgi:hypothetical protein